MYVDKLYRLAMVAPAGSIDRVFTGDTDLDLTGLQPIGYIEKKQVFVSDPLKSEIEQVRLVGGIPPNSVYHCTNSNALPQIAEQKAILCSREVLRIYGDVSTGEIAHTRNNDYPPRTLDDVYAQARIGTSYFFGKGTEYPVNFGIQGVQIKDAYGDGLKLGPKVPLESVVSIIVPDEQLPNTQVWAKENCRPETLVISDYAAALLTTLTSIDV